MAKYVYIGMFAHRVEFAYSGAAHELFFHDLAWKGESQPAVIQ